VSALDRSKPLMSSVFAVAAALILLAWGADTASAGQLGWFGPILPHSTGGSGENALAVACPSTSQCTAVDNQGQQATFDPTASAEPTPTTIDGGNALQGLACTTTSQCIALDNEGGEITFNPTAPGEPARATANLDSFFGLVCPLASECVGVGNPTSNVVVFDPTASSFEPTILAGLDPGPGLEAVSCPSPTQCTIVDPLGQALTFNPQAPDIATAKTTVDSSGQPQAVACASTSQCTAVDLEGREVTFDPLAPDGPTPTRITAGQPLRSVACPATTQCTALTPSEAVSFNPAEPDRQTLTTIEAEATASQVACPSTSQCTAVEGSQWFTFDPSEAVTSALTLAWQPSHLTTSSPRACIAAGIQVDVRLTAVPVQRSGGAKLELVSAAFYLDGRITRTYKETMRADAGEKTAVVVMTYPPTTLARHLPADVRALASSLPPGVHTFKLKLQYMQARAQRRRRPLAITRTLTTKFNVC